MYCAFPHGNLLELGTILSLPEGMLFPHQKPFATGNDSFPTGGHPFPHGNLLELGTILSLPEGTLHFLIRNLLELGLLRQKKGCLCALSWENRPGLGAANNPYKLTIVSLTIVSPNDCRH